MRIGFSVTLTLVALPLVARIAAADVTSPPAPPGRALDLTRAATDDRQFRRWVSKRIAERGGRLSRWGWAQLDDDPAPERFAIVCPATDNDDNAVILIEDTPGKRWSIGRETDGRNECEVNEKASWERDAPSSLELEFRHHGGVDSSYVALRGGRPVVVKATTMEQHFHGKVSCFNEELDFDTLERRYDTCGLDEHVGIVPKGSTRAALFSIDGRGGRYRRTLAGSGDAPGFDVSVRPAARQLRVSVALARPARPGEAIEVWTTGAAGRPLAWSAAWDGTRWQLAGLKRAPRELPPIEGNASVLTIAIVRRAVNEEQATPLTIVVVSADGTTRVATSDLGDETMGQVVAPTAPPRLQVE